jgi:hypothetical protein
MKINYFKLFILLVFIALAVVSCKKDDDPDNQADPWKLMLEETIGPEGGILGDSTFSLEIPAGVFSTSTTLSLYSSSTKVFGDNQASPSFEIRGLPEEFEGTLPIRIKATGPVKDGFHLAAGTLQYAKSYQDTIYFWTYFPATDSAGYILSSIKFVRQGTNEANRGIDPAIDKLEKGKILVNINELSGNILSSKGHFRVIFNKQAISEELGTMVGEGLETALAKYELMGFENITFLQNRYPIQVTYRPYINFAEGNVGDNLRDFGSCSTSGEFENVNPRFDINFNKVNDASTIAIVTGHECFHMVQYCYRTAAESKNWLTEATATYVEEFFKVGTNPYVPREFSSQWYRPLVGMQTGAYFADKDQGVSSSFHGYGMAVLIKYFIENATVQNPLKVMIESLHNDKHPVDAVFSVVPGENPSSFWQIAMLNYVSKTTYPQELLQRSFVIGELYYTLNWAKSVTLSANLTDFPSATFNLPDLSATFVTITLEGDFDPDKEVFLNVTTIGEPEDINLYTWYYIPRGSGETPLLNVPAIGTTKLQSLKDNKYNIVVMITNSRHVSPYTEITHLTLDIRIKGPIAATTSASNVTPTTATLNGLINPNGEITTGFFEYGLTTSYGSTVQIAQNQLNGLDKIPVTAELSGLQPDKMYYYRLTASNPSGVATGEVSSFKTLKENTGPPIATTLEATNVSGCSVTLNGTINPGGTTAYCEFEYGLTTSYGNNWPLSVEYNGGQPITVSLDLSKNYLTQNQTFHYRLNGYRQGYTELVHGADMTFTLSETVEIGQLYQGGIVFYVDESCNHGLIAAQSDIGITDWGCKGTFIGAVDGIDGSVLTAQIIAGCPTENIAAALCNDIATGGYTDWYLPSSAELGVLYCARAIVGDFNDGWTYWSSTETDAEQAYGIDWDQGGVNGNRIPVLKNSALGVRPIRAF